MFGLITLPTKCLVVSHLLLGSVLVNHINASERKEQLKDKTCNRNYLNPTDKIPIHNVGPHEDIGGTVTSIMSFALHCYRVMVVLVCTAGQGESNRYMRASNPLTVTVPPQLWHGVPWWEEWTGGARWNPQPPKLHQASPQYYASLGDGRFWTDPPTVTVPPSVMAWGVMVGGVNWWC